NYTLFDENSEAAARSFVAFEDQRSSQSAAEAMDRDGVLFFGLMSDLAIACWNSKHYPRYGNGNIEIIVRNSETLQFPSGMKIITSKRGRQELWILTASFQKYMAGTLHSNETNFRIQAGFVDELIRGTKCDFSDYYRRNFRPFFTNDPPSESRYFRRLLSPDHYLSHPLGISSTKHVDQTYLIRRFLPVFLGVISHGTNSAARDFSNTMEVIHEWKYIDFVSNDGEEASRDYTKFVPIDVDRWRNYTFVTVIRQEEDIPSSLNTITDRNGPGGPLLAPYPDWSWANVKNCSAIISVYRVAIDRCDRLWVLDTGVVGTDQTCPAKLVVFDLHTSRLLRRIEIPKDVATNSTTGSGLLVTPVVQTFGHNCKRTNVYISDVEGYGLIVYDGDDSFQRLTSSAFDADLRYQNYTIEGQTFQLNDGIIGMALSPRNLLHFNPMSSHNLNAVNTRELLRGNEIKGEDILWTQASAKAASRTGAIFFGLVGDTSIACINEHRPLKRHNIVEVARNRETLQFTSGLKVKNARRGEELLALTNRYQKAATDTYNLSEVNFRILRGNVNRLIAGTACRVK
ncbi:unnamed protein product, partial [Heterotrigona itama]